MIGAVAGRSEWHQAVGLMSSLLVRSKEAVTPGPDPTFCHAILKLMFTSGSQLAKVIGFMVTWKAGSATPKHVSFSDRRAVQVILELRSTSLLDKHWELTFRYCCPTLLGMRLTTRINACWELTCEFWHPLPVHSRPCRCSGNLFSVLS